MELLWNFPHSKMSKMEAKMEVSILELYYIAKFRVRKYRKGIVCGKVATVLELLNLRPHGPEDPNEPFFIGNSSC